MPTAHYLYKTEPRQHQIEAFHTLYGKTIMPLFAEQGLGKTKIMIDIASNLWKEGKIDAVMVIAPNGVDDQWDDEQLPDHSPVPYTSLGWSPKKAKYYVAELTALINKKIDALKWFMVNVEAFSTDTHLKVFREYVKKNRTLVIVDEATRIKNPDANRTQNIILALSDVTKEGRTITAIKPLSAYRAVLTGTMVTTAPYNVWSMYEFLQHDYFGLDYFAFKARYGIQVKMNVPGAGGKGNKTAYRKITRKEIADVRKYAQQGKDAEAISMLMKISERSAQYLIDNPSVNVPYKNLDELKRKIQETAVILRKKDCLDLPPKIYHKLSVPLSDVQKKMYHDLMSDLYTQYADKELSVANKLTLLTRLQQITGGFFPSSEDYSLTPIDGPNAKLNALLDDMEECSDFPIVIVARFVDELYLIQEAVKKRFPDLTVDVVCGKVSKEHRAEILGTFKKGELDVLVANAATIGTGHNLQISHFQYFYSNSFALEDREQVEDRIHRDGQRSPTVVYKDIVAKNSVDERVLEVLLSNRDLLEYMRDKDLGQFLGRAS